MDNGIADTLVSHLHSLPEEFAKQAKDVPPGLAEPLIFQIRNHPNETVYFSPLIGGPRGAFGRFEMDYWGNCLLDATNWASIQANKAGIPLGVAANAWEVLTMDILRYPSLYFRQERQGGFHLYIRLLKGSPGAIAAAAQDPDNVYRVETADGTPLCVVGTGPEYPELKARLANPDSLPKTIR